MAKLHTSGLQLEMTMTNLIKTVKAEIKDSYVQNISVEVFNCDGCSLNVHVETDFDAYTHAMVIVDDEEACDNLQTLTTLVRVGKRMTNYLNERLTQEVEFTGVVEC